MPNITLTLTIPEAVKLAKCCNMAYLRTEEQLANEPPLSQHRERFRNSMTMIQNLKAKIKAACEV